MDFKVQGMTCAHCADRITRAIKVLDPAATVEVRLDGGRVRVSAALAADRVVAAIAEAGYAATAVKSGISNQRCCGSCSAA